MPVPSCEHPLVLLAVTQGQWGERIADNIGRNCPPTWTVQRWAAPRALPLVIDDPDDFLRRTYPPADLLLALGEQPGVAQLIPDLVQRSGARAVIAPVDRNESLPPGLVTQLKRWLAELGVPIVFPRPFCSLTETTYNAPPIAVPYDDPLIRRFAAAFGRPRFRVEVEDGRVTDVLAQRDSACGCGQFVADGLRGCMVREVEEQAGMLHHHYPCLASMNQDAEYHDTLMHVSGHILRAEIKSQIREHLEPAPVFRPAGLVNTLERKETGEEKELWARA